MASSSSFPSCVSPLPPRYVSQFDVSLPHIHHPPSDTNQYLMQIRYKTNTFQPKHNNLTTKHPIPPSIKPTCVSQAIKDPHWRATMCDELNALLYNGTWDLVSPHPKQNVIGCKSCFETRRSRT